MTAVAPLFALFFLSRMKASFRDWCRATDKDGVEHGSLPLTIRRARS
jgi:hypothetical protein